MGDERREEASKGDWQATHHGYYLIEPIEYVDPSPPLQTSLFDEPENVQSLFVRAIDSIISRSPTDEDKKRIISGLHGYLENEETGHPQEKAQPP
jgi:hypothetical protein